MRRGIGINTERGGMRELKASGKRSPSQKKKKKTPDFFFSPFGCRPFSSQPLSLSLKTNKQTLQIRWAAPTATGGAAQGHGLGIYINSHFDSGNVEVLGVTGRKEHFAPDQPHVVDLKIHADPWCEADGREHFQWFYYRVSSAKGERLQMRIVNAGEASFPGGWEGYRAVASYDRKRWFRVEGTSFDAGSGVLTIDHTPAKDAVYYAYFAPYPYERHQALIAEVQASGTDEKEVALEMVRDFFVVLPVFFSKAGEAKKRKRNSKQPRKKRKRTPPTKKNFAL